MVEFVSYTGKWPNLCGGVLTLNIDGEIYKFGHDYEVFGSWKTDGNYAAFWHSGGSCGFNSDYSESYVNEGPWKLDSHYLPASLLSHRQEMIDVFNENVPWGCCGGCL